MTGNCKQMILLFLVSAGSLSQSTPASEPSNNRFLQQQVDTSRLGVGTSGYRPICSYTTVYTPPFDTLIKPGSPQYWPHLNYFRYYICLMSQRVWDIVNGVRPANQGRRLQQGLDPTIIVVSVTLDYIPLFFYQNIIYKRGDFFFFQTVNTGLTLNLGRLLQRAPGQSPVNINAYQVNDFPTRELGWRSILDNLQTKPMLQGLVTKNWTLIRRLVPELGPTFASSVVRANADNMKNIFGVCKPGKVCTPS